MFTEFKNIYCNYDIPCTSVCLSFAHPKFSHEILFLKFCAPGFLVSTNVCMRVCLCVCVRPEAINN